MKKLLLRLETLALSAMLCAPLLAQSATPDKPKAGTEPKVEASWSHQESPELIAARAELVRLQQRYLEKHPLVVDQRQKIETLEKMSPWVFSIDFPGGSLKSFLNAMAKADVVSFTVISAGDQADLETPLPPFALRNANPVTISEVLHNLLEPRGLSLKSNGDMFQNVVGVLTRPVSDSKSLSPTQFESFSLNYQLADQSIDDIVATIREGWELDPAHDKNALRLKFHPATSILLVSGPPAAIQVAARVISQLTGSPDKSFSPNKQPPLRAAK